MGGPDQRLAAPGALACGDDVGTVLGKGPIIDLVVAFGGVLYASSLYADKVIHEKSKVVDTKVNGLVGF